MTMTRYQLTQSNDRCPSRSSCDSSNPSCTIVPIPNPTLAPTHNHVSWFIIHDTPTKIHIYYVHFVYFKSKSEERKKFVYGTRRNFHFPVFTMLFYCWLIKNCARISFALNLYWNKYLTFWHFAFCILENFAVAPLSSFCYKTAIRTTFLPFWRPRSEVWKEHREREREIGERTDGAES